MYFANEASKIYIMHPIGGVYIMPSVARYEKSLFAKHDVSAKADIMYLVTLGIMYHLR